MIKKKKWSTDFPLSRAGKDNAHVLETQIPLGHAVNFPFFEGLYTLKNDLPNSDNIFDSAFLSDGRRIPGFLESSGTRRLDLTSPGTKIIKTISGSVFHFFADDVCDILYALKIHPKAEVIIDLSNVQDFINKPSWSFLGFFFDALQDQGIKFRLVETNKFDVIYINDYCVAEAAFRSSMSGEIMYEFFKKYIDEPKIEPYRSVYLTRKKLDKDLENISTKAGKLSYKSDKRIDSEDELAKVFEELGFEIIAPEDFKDFHEQLNFFNSVKTLASLTSSGLSNAFFMQPGQTMIEVSTPLVVISPLISGEKRITDLVDEGQEDLLVAQELHMFYKMIAYLKDHTYFSINNPARNAQKLRENIHSNLKVLEFLKHDKSNNL
jgi:hypothetical protein